MVNPTKSKISNEEIQQKCVCNWCRTGLQHTTEKITQKNFVDTGKKFANGEKAYAVYCNECLASDTRVKQPKSIINLTTLDEINIDEFPDVKEQKEILKARDETLKATGTDQVLADQETTTTTTNKSILSTTK